MDIYRVIDGVSEGTGEFRDARKGAEGKVLIYEVRIDLLEDRLVELH